MTPPDTRPSPPPPPSAGSLATGLSATPSDQSPTTMHLLREGETVGGVYEVERFISEGAFGEVYRVKHRFLGRLAMKVFKMPTMPLAEAQALLANAGGGGGSNPGHHAPRRGAGAAG